jgi:hypothetical protein
MMEHGQRVRLLAEAFAVLTSSQISEMAVSMDLPRDAVEVLLEENERTWEAIKP